MDIKLFFDPVSEELIDSVAGSNCFGNNIFHYGYSDVKLRDMHVALIGIDDYRGAADLNPDQTTGGSLKIREKLYDLQKGGGTGKIIDLGTLKTGREIDDTRDRLREVCEYLLGHNILPVICGGSHDLSLGQFQSYQSLNKLISYINVDAFLDMGNENNDSENHIEKVLLHEPNFLFNYSHLGYQIYLIDEKYMQNLEKLYFNAYRVGTIRTNIHDMEPVMREGDMLSFDIGAMKSVDAPGTRRPQPFGLTGEEACQLTWYAGINEKMSSAGFYEYVIGNDDYQYKTASVVATMIWYFIEGFSHRTGEKNFRENDYTKYVVSMPSTPEVISFYKSKLSDKWWMEVPLPETSSKFNRNFIIPCSYEDYQIATKGEVPDRYVTTHARLM